MKTHVDSNSPAIAILHAAYEACGRVSDREMGYGMGDALAACFHLGLRFDVGDIRLFVHKLGGGQAFGADGAERYYATAIDCGNKSACESFEAFFGRPAFVYAGKRLAVGGRVRFRGANLAVTSFTKHKETYVLNGCSEKYVTDVSTRGERETGRWIKNRVRLTVDDVREAERERLAAVGREKRVEVAAEALDQWIHKRWDDSGVKGLIADWPEDQLSEARSWHKANEKALYRSGGFEESLAAAPDFIRDIITGYLDQRRRYEAKREIQEALWKRNYERGWSFDYEVADEEIRARLAGDQIVDILARGTLTNCDVCHGYGKLPCDTCGSERSLKCEACAGKGRVPPPPAPPNAADYKALLHTLRLRVEGGEIVGPDAPITPPVPPPTREKPAGLAKLRAEASANMVREAKVLQSPRTKKALRAAGIVGGS